MNYIYLLKEREFIKTDENIFKIGRSCQDNTKRVNKYPKGSLLLLQAVCNNCLTVEKQIKDNFCKTFKQRKDIGTEYFEGSFISMINIIFELLKEDYKNSDITLLSSKSEKMSQEVIKEKEQQIIDFINSKYDIIEKGQYLKSCKLDKKKFRVDSRIFYHEYINWSKCQKIEPVGIKLFNKLIKQKIDQVKISGYKNYLCRHKIKSLNT